MRKIIRFTFCSEADYFLSTVDQNEYFNVARTLRPLMERAA